MASTDTVRFNGRRNRQIRTDWLNELGKMQQVVLDDDIEVRNLVADRVLNIILEEGPSLGRSVRWQNAIALIAEHERDGASNHWLVVQGSIWLGYANL